MQQGNKTMGIISIVLGAFAIVCAYIYMANIAAVIAAIVGIILAVMSKKSFTAAGQTSPIPTVGLVLSIIGLVMAVIGVFACTICVCTTKGALDAAASDPNFASNLSSALNGIASDLSSSLSSAG